MSEEPPIPTPGRPDPGDVRASDADRETLADELREHAVAGRLDTDEFEERLQATYAARTTKQLAALRRDLPPSTSQVALSERQRRSHLTRRMFQETGGSAGAFVVGTAIWLAAGAHGQFWPVWILIAVLLTAGRSAWALFGPAPDLDAAEQALDARQRKRRDQEELRADSRRRERHRRR